MHEFKSEEFHERCDGKGKTLSITKTTMGKVFGFYTPIPWQNSGAFVKGKCQSFIFSLQEDGEVLKFDCIEKDKEVYHASNMVYSMIDIWQLSECDKHKKSNSQLGWSYAQPTHIPKD